MAKHHQHPLTSSEAGAVTDRENRFCYPCRVQYELFTYPPCDAPLMDAYGGIFESAYVVFHPFIGVPRDLAWKATKQYPSDEEIASCGAKCTWATVAAQTGLNTCSKVNQALLTSIESIGEELCDYPASGALKRFLETQPIWMPSEGRFEPLLQMDLLDIFAAKGHRELIFVPEFPDNDPTRQFDVASLRARAVPFPHHGTLMAPDASVLVTVDWDSFFTLVFGPRAFLADIVRQHNLEGFFATPTTEHFWFNYSLGCSIVTTAPDGWPAS